MESSNINISELLYKHIVQNVNFFTYCEFCETALLTFPTEVIPELKITLSLGQPVMFFFSCASEQLDFELLTDSYGLVLPICIQLMHLLGSFIDLLAYSGNSHSIFIQLLLIKFILVQFWIVDTHKAGLWVEEGHQLFTLFAH